MNYRIGLDIGIASVGWAVLENDVKDEPKKIVDLGVRIFEAAEIPKTGESLAAPRREARTTRRRLRRRRHRLERIRYLLDREDIIELNEFMDRYHKSNLPDVYQLRYEALERRLKDEELAQVLIHIAKHRGFKSTRKAETKETEGGKVLTATKQNEVIFKEKGYRTVGEMIYLDEAFKVNAPWRAEGVILAPRNKQDDYKHTILRDMLEDEVKIIFARQRELGNQKTTEKLEQEYLNIMLSQRSFDKGPGNQANGLPSPYGGNLIEKMVGKCTLEPDEKRASKATFTSERFVLLQKVNNLRLVNADGETRALFEEERYQVIELAYKLKDVKYTAIRKALGLREETTFKDLSYGKGNIKDIENKSKFISLQWYHEFKKRLGEKFVLDLSKREIVDNIAQILTMYKSDEERQERLAKYELSDEVVDSLIELNPSKFQHLSLKAMKKIIPYLEQGLVYNEACDKAGYDFKADNKNKRAILLQGECVNSVLDDIPNPVVKRSVSQTIKVINAIIRKYGSPQAIHIELAREMSKDFKERQKIDKENKKNRTNNEAVKKRIQELGVLNPTGQDILKFRLWQDQGEVCLYTGNNIPITRLFEKGEYDIDHIIPYSICFDDSYKNKVLVEAGANREKGNRIPYEYMGNEENRWHKYELLIERNIKDYRKRQILLKKSFTKEDREGFKERNLTDTKYITRVVYNLLRQNLEFAPYYDEQKIKRVVAVNGAITSYLRKRWGLMQKDRSTDKHHAMDATVVACCTDGMIQKISRYVKGRELAQAYNLKYVDEETGEIFERRNYTKDEWDKIFGVRIPPPWNHFKNELEMRMSDDPMYFASDFYKMGYSYGEEIKPIFVSRMPKHKVTGAGHAETIRGPRHFEDEGIVLSKTALTSLKLDKNNEIEGYYNPESDRLLYEAIKRQLLLYSGDAVKAFAEPFYKPKSDGSQGPLVKKVKTFKKQTMGVYTNCGNGIAENGNGSMVRVDVFKVDGKYYFVPIYTSDTKKEYLPCKAVKAHKPYDEWKDMDEKDFIFSLYSRDLIMFKHKTGMNARTNEKNEIKLFESLSYYISADIATASFLGIAHDHSYEYRGLGIQSLIYLKKYQVDVLGNVTEVKSEKRMRFR